MARRDWVDSRDRRNADMNSIDLCGRGASGLGGPTAAQLQGYLSLRSARVWNMAEQAQLHLETGLLELSELGSLGVLSAERIRYIVSTRRKFEFRLKRRGAMIEDFLSYIEKELSFDVELKDRLQAMALQGIDPLLASYFLKHVYVIYRRALAKFPGRVDVWLQFLQLAMSSGSAEVFARGSARALRLHPHAASLWCLCARFEFYSRGNVEAARKILQKALRFNQTAVELWDLLLTLEIAYAENALERQKILGVDNGDLDLKAYSEIILIVFDEALKARSPKTPPHETLQFLQSALRATSRLSSLPHTISDMLVERFGQDSDFLERLADCWMQLRTLEAVSKALTITEGRLAESPSAETLDSCARYLCDAARRPGVSESLELVRAIHSVLCQLIALARRQGIAEPCVLHWERQISKLDIVLSGGEEESLEPQPQSGGERKGTE